LTAASGRKPPTVTLKITLFQLPLSGGKQSFIRCESQPSEVLQSARNGTYDNSTTVCHFRNGVEIATDLVEELEKIDTWLKGIVLDVDALMDVTLIVCVTQLVT
jgi:hypothetical protein